MWYCIWEIKCMAKKSSKMPRQSSVIPTPLVVLTSLAPLIRTFWDFTNLSRIESVTFTGILYNLLIYYYSFSKIYYFYFLLFRINNGCLGSLGTCPEQPPCWVTPVIWWFGVITIFTTTSLLPKRYAIITTYCFFKNEKINLWLGRWRRVGTDHDILSPSGMQKLSNKFNSNFIIIV